jgi:hypothetical protein
VILRRRRCTPEVQASFDAFHAVLEHLEPAKAALTDVMPTTRMPGRPLPDALAEFEEGLGRAETRMPGWRTADLEPEWVVCEHGLAEARERARRFREDAPEVGGFEGLIWAVEELMAPLDGFATAAERFRELGARSTRLPRGAARDSLPR